MCITRSRLPGGRSGGVIAVLPSAGGSGARHFSGVGSSLTFWNDTVEYYLLRVKFTLVVLL